MAARLAGKVAIVTGAGSSGPGIGTGKAISTLFAREGAKVLLADKNVGAAEETLAGIRQDAGDASVFEGDVTQAADCAAIVAAAEERYGPLDILVNNVGILGAGSVADLTEEVWDRTMSVNLKSMVLMSKYAVPRMAASGGGSIVNLSSIAGLRSSGGGAVPYSVSKGGVITLTQTMALDQAGQGVRVNAIAPGMIYTPMVAGDMSPETRTLRRLAGPLGTEGTAWDIAWAALFLASDEARWVTAVVLPVDAGLVASTPMAMVRHLK